MGRSVMYCCVILSAWLPRSVSTTGGWSVTSTTVATCDGFSWKSEMTVCPTATVTPLRISVAKPGCSELTCAICHCRALQAGLCIDHIDSCLRQNRTGSIRYSSSDLSRRADALRMSHKGCEQEAHNTACQ